MSAKHRTVNQRLTRAIARNRPDLIGEILDEWFALTEGNFRQHIQALKKYQKSDNYYGFTGTAYQFKEIGNRFFTALTNTSNILGINIDDRITKDLRACLSNVQITDDLSALNRRVIDLFNYLDSIKELFDTDRD